MGRRALGKYSLKTSQNSGRNSLVLNGFFCGRKILFQKIRHFTCVLLDAIDFLDYFIKIDFLSPTFLRAKCDLLNKINIPSKARWVASSKYINIQCVIFHQRWNIYTLKSSTPGNKRMPKISTTAHSLVIRSLCQMELVWVCTTMAYTYNGYV